MKCKSRFCDLESGHKGRCQRLTGAINRADDAINRRAAEVTCAGVGPADVGEVNPIGGEGAAESSRGGRAPNRRSREAYNRYMREYMKKRRRGFIGIAYG